MMKTERRERRFRERESEQETVSSNVDQVEQMTVIHQRVTAAIVVMSAIVISVRDRHRDRGDRGRDRHR